jgi:hypothetical protein
MPTDSVSRSTAVFLVFAVLFGGNEEKIRGRGVILVVSKRPIPVLVDEDNKIDQKVLQRSILFRLD